MLPLSSVNHVKLDTYGVKYLDELYELIQSEKGRLEEWFLWPRSIQSKDDLKKLLERQEYAFWQGMRQHHTIWADGELVGVVEVHTIIQQHRKGELSYWLKSSAVGKGIVTFSCGVLIDHAFSALKLNKLTLRSAKSNLKSVGVAKRLDFEFEGIEKEAELINGEFHDHNIYVLFARDWPEKRKSVLG
ncbi:GNAT family N-acetyltransferase [Aureibacter tunicatorum]|uniref:Ribosomal-protein-serine acetyltransferase n=1 Tax=Aureibacter tunicatorum TaxID=866807 RepID=A0AAE3XKQ6_9BACT|nr:GNAT family N-acetyltransferase [Aureibacter tunicatorum]MDR6237788.1 ribosomal-protein-serine acetyltransferase [Aureibacter tunicatorum]BDD02823.1 hypothetical protein AUTU_03060 [Aureibacter tunicatorum]